MAQPETTTTDDITEYLAQIDAPERRRDAETLVELMQRVTGEPPRLAGTIVGFGQYHYRYESGREGDSTLVGFAARKGDFSIYLTGTYFEGQQEQRELLLGRLGRHKMGKACLYVRKLADIDLNVLEELIEMSVGALRAHYPDSGN